MRLQCSNHKCASILDRNFSGYACPQCGDLLEVLVGSLPVAGDALKQSWCQRRSSNHPLDRSGVWRFREFLPAYKSGEVITLGEGNTPLLVGMKSSTYAKLSGLFFKHLGWNPTGCFKDLGMTVAITEAKRRGARVVACASTGNTAASLAAYAARAGLAARVYLPKNKVARAKIAQSIDYGAEIVEVDGNFDQSLEVLLSKQEADTYFLNSVNPLRIEGQKTVMFELMEQLEWKPPDYIIVPGGNLGNSAAFGKGLEELAAAGLISKIPRLVIVQASGANALVRTVIDGGQQLKKIPLPHTRATAICIGAPRSWKKALRALAFTNGLVSDVDDEEIAEAKAVIGRDGIGCEPASAATLAGLRQLRRKGEIDRNSVVVAILTGHVLKDPDAILESQADREAVLRCVR